MSLQRRFVPDVILLSYPKYSDCNVMCKMCLQAGGPCVMIHEQADIGEIFEFLKKVPKADFMSYSQQAPRHSDQESRSPSYLVQQRYDPCIWFFLHSILPGAVK